MIKYYLVPSEGDGKTIETQYTPKFVSNLNLSWSGVRIVSKNMFVIMVNSKDTTKLTDLEKNDVIDITPNTRATKDLCQTKLGITIRDSDDTVESLAKLQEPNFDKDKMWVSD